MNKVRCKLSKKWIKLYGGDIYKRGVIVPYRYMCQGERNNLVRVKWEDNTSMLEYAKEFIEIIPK